MSGEGELEDRAPACWAPRRALYFRPDGQVSACCATGHQVGTVTGPDRRTIREIWDGARLAAQRHALQHGDHSMGCTSCAAPEGERHATFAASFDRWADQPDDHPAFLDLALSNRCNLACEMCNGNLSSTVRAQRERLAPLPPAYDDRFFGELDEFLAHARAAHFKGGEPFLAPEVRRTWDQIERLGLDLDVTVTTNGTVWDERVAHHVRALRMRVVVSVDAIDPSVLQQVRIGIDPDRLWANVDRFAALADEVGRPIELNFCFTTSTWHQLAAFLERCEALGAEAGVVPVFDPPRFDVARLPDQERERVLATLRDHPPTVTDPALLAIWDATLGHLDRPTPRPAPAPVAVRVASAAAHDGLAPHEVAELRRALERAHGVPGIEVELEHGVVRCIEVPGWAGGWGLEAWVGRTPDQLAPELEQVAGARPLSAAQLPAEHRGTTRLALVAPGEASVPGWEVVRFERTEAGRSGILLHPARAALARGAR